MNTDFQPFAATNTILSKVCRVDFLGTCCNTFVSREKFAVVIHSRAILSRENGVDRDHIGGVYSVYCGAEYTRPRSFQYNSEMMGLPSGDRVTHNGSGECTVPAMAKKTPHLR